jgi:hypothetical protein
MFSEAEKKTIRDLVRGRDTYEEWRRKKWWRWVEIVLTMFGARWCVLKENLLSFLYLNSALVMLRSECGFFLGEVFRGSQGRLRIMWSGAEGELEIHLLSSIRSTRESRELTDVTSAMLWIKCESLITRWGEKWKCVGVWETLREVRRRWRSRENLRTRARFRREYCWLQSCNGVCFEILLFGRFELLLLARREVLLRRTWELPLLGRQ